METADHHYDTANKSASMMPLYRKYKTVRIANNVNRKREKKSSLLDWPCNPLVSV